MVLHLALWMGREPAARKCRWPAARACAADNSVKVSTFNLLCPAYRRIGDQRESDYPEMYMARHEAILELPFWQESDIVCCQEFWYADADVFGLYVKRLLPRFQMHGLQRSGDRPDGLFMAITHEWEVVHEDDLDFGDVAGRCAQVLHLRRKEDAGGDQVKELLVVNVHLLFPHNEALARVRLREIFKVLAKLDAYKVTLAAPPPTLICGDLNGPTGSVVAQCLARYGWRDSYSEYSGCDLLRCGEGAQTDCGWVSHRNHLGLAEGVDYIWVSDARAP